MVSYFVAQEGETDLICRLLDANGLPFSDITESGVQLIVAKVDDEIVGCIGLEIHEEEGLLRSFAVKSSYRGRGIGRSLYNSLLHFSIDHHIRTLHLLTNTAEDYFTKVGFVIGDRCNAPELIKKSREFACLCPSSALYMVLETPR